MRTISKIIAKGDTLIILFYSLFFSRRRSFLRQKRQPPGYIIFPRGDSMKIYLDILLISNAVITLIFVKLLTLIVHIRISGKRYALCMLIGGAASLLMLIRPENFGEGLLMTLAKLISVGLTVRAGFGKQSAGRLFTYTAVYVAVNIAFGGICMVIWEMTGSNAVRISNYAVYFDVPLWLLIVCVSATYLLITLYERLTFFSKAKERKFKARFALGDISVTLPAVSDTGNRLTDSFSGEPVVIFSSSRLFDSLGLGDESSYSFTGFHLIPYSTVSSTSLMPVTLRGRVTIISEDGAVKELNCASGIIKSSGSERAIFDPRLLI